MTPAQEIAKLDRKIAERGQTAKLERLSPAASGTLRVFFRGYRADELSGGIQQGDSTAIVSPTGLAQAGITDMPAVNWKLTVSGRKRNVQAVEQVVHDDVLVRLNLWLRG